MLYWSYADDDHSAQRRSGTLKPSTHHADSRENEASEADNGTCVNREGLAHLWMGRESNLTLICIGTSINRGFGCDMGNVESLGWQSPINGRGSLLFIRGIKSRFSNTVRGGLLRGSSASHAHSNRVFCVTHFCVTQECVMNNLFEFGCELATEELVDRADEVAAVVQTS